jgi:hypothetical protein
MVPYSPSHASVEGDETRMTQGWQAVYEDTEPGCSAGNHAWRYDSPAWLAAQGARYKQCTRPGCMATAEMTPTDIQAMRMTGVR